MLSNVSTKTGEKIMTINDLRDQDPMFFDYLVDDIKDTFDGDLNMTIKELANQFDLPVNIVKSILIGEI